MDCSSIRDKKHCGKAKRKKRVVHLKKKIRPTDCLSKKGRAVSLSKKKKQRIKRGSRRWVCYKIRRGQASSIGSQVPSSTQGTPGAQGLQGAQGPQGLQGPQGVQDPQGQQTERGLQGFAGIQGDGGLQGPEGAQGLLGPAGAQGPQGPEGAQGLLGPTGAQGPSGPEGAQGSLGPTGAQGPSGPEGAQGPSGPAGPQGPSGPEGARGPLGPTGPQGPPGEIPAISIIPTVYRYFYFPPVDIDSTVDIPANQFTDDNGGVVAEFEGVGANSYTNLYINGILQEGSLYSLNEPTLTLFLNGGLVLAETPIIVENVEFLAQVA